MGAEVKARAGEWMPELRSKGERQTFIDGVTAADRNTPQYANLLLAKYPDAAFDALTRSRIGQSSSALTAQLSIWTPYLVRLLGPSV